MKRVIAKADFGFYGEEYEKEFEFKGDITEEEIREAIWEWVTDYIDVDYEVLEDEEKQKER